MGRNLREQFISVMSNDLSNARIWPATLSSIIPLPVAGVPSTDPSHWTAYPEHKNGSIVLALYPETTSFYKAQVIASPKELTAAGARVSKM